MRRRVWCETLPYAEVGRPGLVALLRARQVEVLLAVRPWQLAEVGATVASLVDGGVAVGLWPMVADADGRWVSAGTAAAWVAFADQALAAAPRATELVLDLEPPLAQLAAWKGGRLTLAGRPTPAAYAEARAVLATAVERWRLDRRVTTALLPMLVAELGGEWLQRLLGTPASRLPVDRHSVMAYTSLYEGWSRGLVGRRRAEALLVATARLARLRFGGAAALSLGCVDTGALGDEPAYRDPAELARDVALARRVGVDEVTVFDLGGMVRRGPVERWLDAFAAR
ncbi:MAG: hypothetical protein R3B06_23920 [Kofleriaceae bacterium]